jgi:SAM-dependent methyltransferase
MTPTLSIIMPHLIYSFKSEDELVKSIEEISAKFTTHRERIADYLKDPRLVAAYTAFYLLTNIPKLEEVFNWMNPEWVQELKSCDFIDLGAGPGTFSLAWKSLGGEGDFYQVELSPLMREQAKKLWEGLYGEKIHQSSDWVWKTDRPKFLLFGHSANEMGVDLALKYIQKIEPNHILFIEPGTKDFFGKMLEIRSSVIKQGYRVLYPCSLQEDCPMKGTLDWCHQFIKVRHDDEVERLSQMVRKDRKLLPLIVQAFSKTFRSTNPKERLVRVLPETKFSHEWEVCHDNKLQRYQIMKRDLSKVDSKDLGNILAGEALRTELIKEVEEVKRVKSVKVIKL